MGNTTSTPTRTPTEFTSLESTVSQPPSDSVPVADPLPVPVVVQQGGSDDVPATEIEMIVLRCLNNPCEPDVVRRQLQRVIRENAVDRLFHPDVVSSWSLSDTPTGKKKAFEYIHSKVELLVMIRQTLDNIRGCYSVNIVPSAIVRLSADMRKLTDLYNKLGKETFMTVEQDDILHRSAQKRLMWKDIPSSSAELTAYMKTYVPMFTKYVKSCEP
jgi:transposase